MSEVEPTVSLPTHTSANFWAFNNPRDAQLTIFMGFVALIGWVLTSMLAVFPVAVVWALLMLRNGKARTYVRIGRWVKGSARRRFRKGVIFARQSTDLPEEPRPVGSDVIEADMADETATVSSKKRFKKLRRRSEKRLINFVTASVPDDHSQHGHIGFVHHYPTRLDLIPITGEGASISAMSPARQQWAHETIAGLIKSLPAIGRSVSVGVSFVNRYDPADVYGYMARVEEVNHPKALTDPEVIKTPLDQRWHTCYQVQEALANEFLPQTREPWMIMLIAVRQEGVLAKASKSHIIGARWVGRLLINKAVRIAVAQLSVAGVIEPRALDLAEVNDFVRGSHPGGIDKYYEARESDPNQRYSSEFTGHWPQWSMRATNSHGETDGICHTVLRVTAFPPNVDEAYFRRVDSQIDVPCFSRATVGEAVQSTRELWWLERGTAIISDLGTIIGIDRQTLAAQDRDRRLEERKLDIHASQYSLQFSHLYALFATSPEELDGYVDSVLTELSKHGMSAKRITGVEYQYPALWSATLGLPNV